MIRGDRKYYAIIIFVFLTLFLIQQFQREPTNYNHTFSHLDKNPYGGYVLKDLLPDFLGGNEVESLNKTLYEVQEDLTYENNLLILADQIFLDKQDSEALLDGVGLGMTAFISSSYIYGVLPDTIGFQIDNDYFNYVVNANQDTVTANLVGVGGFRFKSDAVASYFSGLDSIDHQVLATDAKDRPIAIKVPWGGGDFIFNSTPLAFTNNYIFFENNADYAAGLLTQLPPKPTIWSEYYQLGRIEIRTPMRVILTTPSLKLAYGVTMGGLFLFMIFEAKRKQRIIPIITPLKNTTLEFIKTIGNLYIKQGNHKDIALKRIQFFHEYIRAKYYMNFEKFDTKFFEKLAAKSGQSVSGIMQLFDLMEKIKKQDKIDSQDLKMLNKEIEAFYGRKH